MKKLAITGHTDGIGSAVVDILKDQYIIVGMSRATEHQLTKESTVEKVFTDSKDCDIFINNAVCRDRQELLFKKFYSNWKSDASKHIVNINSKLRLKVPNNENDRAVHNYYTRSKHKLHRAWMDVLHDTGRKCKISNISPGFVDTKLVSYVHLPDGMKLDRYEVAKYIKWVLEQPEIIELGELSFWRRRAVEQ